MAKNLDYEVGDTITYRPFCGPKRTGVVIEKDEDIKNGRPGFSMEDHWGYDDQITDVRRG